MRIDIKLEPESLSTNLRHLALALPVGLMIGAVQVALSDSPAWWHEAYASLRQTGVTDILLGLLAGMSVLVMSKLVSLGWAAMDTDWVYKAFAAIPPSHRSIWLLSTFAAVFEELLFRAALVPLVGVLGSACLFATVHIGVLLFAPSKAAASCVFVDLLLFGIAMGLLFAHVGLAACMAAHLVHNVVAFHIARTAWTRAHNDWRAERAVTVMR